ETAAETAPAPLPAGVPVEPVLAVPPAQGLVAAPPRLAQPERASVAHPDPALPAAARPVRWALAPPPAAPARQGLVSAAPRAPRRAHRGRAGVPARSEEHTSELQSRSDIVC